MALIAVRAGVSVGAIYKHYPSRTALMCDLYERTASRELAQVKIAAAAAGTSPLDRLSAAIRTFCHRALRGGRFTYTIMAEPIDAEVEAMRREFRNQFSDFFAELLREAREQGEIPDQDVTLAASGLLGAMIEVLVPPLIADAPSADRKESAIPASLIAFSLRAVGATPKNPSKG
jgi:AcrR family transcriptional regulator